MDDDGAEPDRHLRELLSPSQDDDAGDLKCRHLSTGSFTQIHCRDCGAALVDGVWMPIPEKALDERVRAAEIERDHERELRYGLDRLALTWGEERDQARAEQVRLRAVLNMVAEYRAVMRTRVVVFGDGAPDWLLEEAKLMERARELHVAIGDCLSTLGIEVPDIVDAAVPETGEDGA